MEKYVYIKQSISKHFLYFAEPLKSADYDNLGSTWEDYIDNYWVPLTNAQVAFHEKYPQASVKEVWDMELHPHQRMLEEAKEAKIAEITAYDQSDVVNSFSIGGQDMWLTVEEREQIATQISANESVGRETMTKWFNGNEFTFSLAQWKQMLIALEVYAGDALNVTENHKANIRLVSTIEAVDSYDYTTGYPTKLVF